MSNWDDAGGWSPDDDWDSGDWEEYFAGPEERLVEFGVDWDRANEPDDLEEVLSYYADLAEPSSAPRIRTRVTHEVRVQRDLLAEAERDARTTADSRGAFRPVPDNPWVFHLTSMTAFCQILANGEMRAPSQLLAAGLGDQHLIEMRSQRPVPVGPGGVVTDYVAFHLTPFTPFSYRVTSRNDPDSLVLLTSRSSHLAGLAYVVSPINCCSPRARFELGRDGFRSVNWSAVSSPWSRLNMRARQAELLVHGSVPVERLHAVWVKSDSAKGELERALRGARLVSPCPVAVKPTAFH